MVGAEVHSRGLNISTDGRDMAGLFGDGAGAVVVEASENQNRGILSTHLYADGRFVRELWSEAPGSAHPVSINEEMVREGKFYPRMNGREVFKQAVIKFRK